MSNLPALQRRQADLELKRRILRENLPHLYGFPWYTWAKEFFHSQNRMNLLCAGNQLSKSSTQIRKAIHWATCPELWPTLWPTVKTPTQFWYLYPDRDTVHREFIHKWETEFMPRGPMKDHKIYGWQPIIGDKRKIDAIKFNSGITIYFKTYAQQVKNLQSGTPQAIFADEEIPEEYYDELAARLFASKGHFHLVFTATLGQATWKRAIEGRGAAELFPDAWKRQVSMYDCQFYDDGSESPWTLEDIKRAESTCRTENERLRRIHGRFVVETGRKYPQFDPARDYISSHPIPNTWVKYVGIDIGSGGVHGHPPAICFIAIRPDYRYGVVYDGWLGDDGPDYTSSDIYLKYIELKGADSIAVQKFDQQAKDFGVIATRAGDPFLPSDKNHEKGEHVLNTLFQNGMLKIFDTDQLAKLGNELSYLLRDTKKNKAKDDFTDALRYGIVDAPWDWEALRGVPTKEEIEAKKEKKVGKPLTEEQKLAESIRKRRGMFANDDQPKSSWQEYEEEIAEWNEYYG